MRALGIVCLVAALHSIAAVTPFDDEDQQNDEEYSKGRDVKRDRQTTDPPPSLHDLTLITTTTTVTTVPHDGRTNASTNLTAKSLPNKRCKHRRRHRNKNCVTCAARQRNFTSQSYEPIESPPVAENDKGTVRPTISSLLPIENAYTRRSKNATGANTDDGTSNQRSNATTVSVSNSESDAESKELKVEETVTVPFNFSNLDEIEIEEDEDVIYDEYPRSNANSQSTYTRDYEDDETLSSNSTSTDYGSQFHEGLTAVLTRLFQALRNVSEEARRKESNTVASLDEDPCQKWLKSWDKFKQVFQEFLDGLPACPCQYPSNIFYDDKVWDEVQQKFSNWRDVSGRAHRIDVYKPGAAYCVRSLLAQGTTSAAAQHCCYDLNRKLLTRGSGAGTPNLISPEVSSVLHEKIDRLPWRLCKGDFSRFNHVRPPNNANACETNPDDEEYQRQLDDTKHY